MKIISCPRTRLQYLQLMHGSDFQKDQIQLNSTHQNHESFDVSENSIRLLDDKENLYVDRSDAEQYELILLNEANLWSRFHSEENEVNNYCFERSNNVCIKR